MASLLRAARSLFQRKPWSPLQFPTVGFQVITCDYVIEEETLKDYNGNIYYPVRIGQVLASRYQVMGKLGFGVSSTAWLARDLSNRTYATLKIYTREHDWSGESETYKALSKGSAWHPGRHNVGTALDTFTIPREGGNHQCLVQKPVADTLDDLRKR